MADRMFDVSSLPSLSLPFAAAAAPALRADGPLRVADECRAGVWSLALAAENAPSQTVLDLPLGVPGVAFLGTTSLPAAWLPARELAFVAARIVIASADLADVVAIETSRPVQLALARGADGLRARMTAHLEPGTPLQVHVRPGVDALPHGGRLPDESLPAAAASFYCAFFAALGAAPQARFGALLQDRRRILEHFMAVRADLEALGAPAALELLGSPGGVAGWLATWRDRAFLLLAGEGLSARIRPGTARVDLFGEGRLAVMLPEDAASFTAYAWDYYGRPQAAWGGRARAPEGFALEPGGLVMLEMCPEYRYPSSV